HEGGLQGPEAVGRNIGRRHQRQRIKNGVSAKTMTASALGSLVSSQPVGTSCSSGRRVVRAKWRKRSRGRRQLHPLSLLQRNNVEYRMPKVVPRKLDPAKQQAFIDGYTARTSIRSSGYGG